MSRNKKLLIIGLMAFTVIAIASTLLIYLVLQSRQSFQSDSIQPDTTQAPTVSYPVSAPLATPQIEGTYLHNDEIYPFSIELPKSFTIDNTPEGSCGTVFVSSGALKSFSVCSHGVQGSVAPGESSGSHEEYVKYMQGRPDDCADCGRYKQVGKIKVDGYEADTLRRLSAPMNEPTAITMEVFVDHILPDSLNLGDDSYLVAIATIDMNNIQSGEKQFLDILKTMKIEK